MQNNIRFIFAVFAIVSATSCCQAEQYAKLSPFNGVRWEGENPEVKIDGEWFSLVSLDDIGAKDIVAFSKRTFGNRWQKRFEEDLVEVLAGMEHDVNDTVRLVVRPLESSETLELDEVAMTEENRRAIRNAAAERLGEETSLQPAVPIDDAERFSKSIDEFLNAAWTKTGFSGSVVVARGGRTIYSGAFGFSHLESRAPSTIDTPFRIASLSKQFTAAAIFRLAADGKLNIDDPVHQHLTEFAEFPHRDITIHHLLTHTSGLPRTPERRLDRIRWKMMSKQATPVDDYVRLAVEMPLQSKPGSEYKYSNFGFRVLSALIARVADCDYADYMEHEIFEPLGMKNTGVARITRPSSESRIAEGLALVRFDTAGPVYTNGEEGRNFGCGYGSGGIFTSAGDLLLWDRALASDEFLAESQQKRLFQPIHNHYACGWIVKKSGLDGRLYQTHSGGNEGFFSKMMRLPEDDLVIIAVGNVDTTDSIDDAIEQLFRLCRSLPYRNP